MEHSKPHAHILLTQMSIKAGREKFGQKGNNVLMKELQQLHIKAAILSKRKDELTYEDRQKALRYLMYVKEKRERGCAGGRLQ